MSVTRIVRRNLQKSSEAQRMYHKRERVFFLSCGQKAFRPRTAWRDRRPRDKFGCLPGPCAERARKEREAEAARKRLMGE